MPERSAAWCRSGIRRTVPPERLTADDWPAADAAAVSALVARFTAALGSGCVAETSSFDAARVPTVISPIARASIRTPSAASSRATTSIASPGFSRCCSMNLEEAAVLIHHAGHGHRAPTGHVSKRLRGLRFTFVPSALGIGSP